MALPKDGEQELEARLREFLFAVEHGHAGRGVMIDAPDFDVKIREARVRDFEGREAGAGLGHREPFRLVELDGLGLVGVEGDDLAGWSGGAGFSISDGPFVFLEAKPII